MCKCTLSVASGIAYSPLQVMQVHTKLKIICIAMKRGTTIALK